MGIINKEDVMGEKLSRFFNIFLTILLVFQLSGCGTLLYPERRGQIAGRLDTGIVILDAIGLLFVLIPGIIAFAVDFSNGTIYLPAHGVIIEHSAQLRQIKFDPKHTSLAQLERIIKDQTGYTVHLNADNVRISRLNSKDDMMTHFAQAADIQNDRLAFNR
jgi:hypothetical protein